MTTPLETAAATEASAEAVAPEGIRWGRVIVGGLLDRDPADDPGGLFYGLGRMEDLNTWILPSTALAAVLAGAWTARGTAQPVLNGGLAGVAALVIYGVLVGITARCRAGPGRFQPGLVDHLPRRARPQGARRRRRRLAGRHAGGR